MIATILCAAMMPTGEPNLTKGSLYDFTMKDIDGKAIPLKAFKANVVLVVNVASQCGLTPQYASLESLYKTYKPKGFAVLGFPANEFGQQEPGSNASIKKFCTETYHVTFPMFEKIVVKGPEMHPLYSWLIEQSGKPEDIAWNFEKFLVGRNGEVIERFSPKTKPDSPEVVAAIEKALAAKGQ